MSVDENIVVKDEAEPFFVDDIYEENAVVGHCVKEKVKKDNNKEKEASIKHLGGKSWKEICGQATNYKRTKKSRDELIYILKKLRKRNISITDTWENWVKVAFSIASSVHPEKGRELFLEFCRLDGAKHNEAKSEHLILDAYRKNQNKCSINTIIYLARQKGVVLDK